MRCITLSFKGNTQKIIDYSLYEGKPINFVKSVNSFTRNLAMQKECKKT